MRLPTPGHRGPDGWTAEFAIPWGTNFFGHLDGLAKVTPDQRLLLLPYVAAAFDATANAMQSQLIDLTGPARRDDQPRLRGQSGSTIEMAAAGTFDHPSLTAILSFPHGLSPL